MSRSRVTLVVPPGAPDTTPNREGASGLGAVVPYAGGFRYPPHTVATAAAALRRAGIDVTVIDAVAEGLSLDTCVQRLDDEGGKVIAGYVSWATREADAAFFAALRQVCDARRLVAFGISTHFIRNLLCNAHHVLLGEPERSLVALCRALLTGKADLPHAVTPVDLACSGYDANGQLTDLNALPFPAWDLLPIEAYHYLTLSSSRGCESDCTWCPYVLAQGRVYRAMSPARVVAELVDMVTRYHPRRIILRDPAFAHDARRVAAICRRIVVDHHLEPGVNLLWECESRPEHLTPPLLRLMSLAGCVGIKIGLEATDPDILVEQHRVARAARVPAYLAHVASLARSCAYWGIGYRVFVMVGLPGQDVVAAQDLAAFVRAIQPTDLSIKPFIAYPGVALAESSRSGAPIDMQMAPLREAQRVLGQSEDGIEGRVRRLMARWRRVFGRHWIRWRTRVGANDADAYCELGRA